MYKQQSQKQYKTSDQFLQQQIQIDQQWIHLSPGHNSQNQLFSPNYLTCIICYGIPLGQIYQCQLCGRIICESDYKQIIQKLNNGCPMCNVKPFKVKKNIHIIYKNIFQKLKFQCKICKDNYYENVKNNNTSKIKKDEIQQKGEKKQEKKVKQQKQELNKLQSQNKEQSKSKQKNIDENQQKSLLFSQVPSKIVKQSQIIYHPKIYTKKQLLIHINQDHKSKIYDLKTLFDFQILINNNSNPVGWENKKSESKLNQKFKQNNQVFSKIVFDFYQNLQLNHIYNQIISTKSNPKVFYQLDNGQQLIINFIQETVLINKVTTGKLIKRVSKHLERNKDYIVWQISLDYGFKYYSQNFQNLLEKEYTRFLKNSKLNEFNFDLHEVRYRVMFNIMVQVNTSTGYQRHIKRDAIRIK